MRKFVTTFVLLVLGLGAAMHAQPAQAEEQVCREGFLNKDYELPDAGIVVTITSWGRVKSRIVVASDGSLLSEKVEFDCGLVTSSVRGELSSEEMQTFDEAMEAIFAFQPAEDACVAAPTSGNRGWYARYENAEKVDERVFYMPCLEFPGYASMLAAELNWWPLVMSNLPKHAD